MSSLTEQILERFTGGDTIARADLTLPANYDSVGRALGDLVEARKITRVGRGRYSRASSSVRLRHAVVADVMGCHSAADISVSM